MERPLEEMNQKLEQEINKVMQENLPAIKEAKESEEAGDTLNNFGVLVFDLSDLHGIDMFKAASKGEEFAFAAWDLKEWLRGRMRGKIGPVPQRILNEGDVFEEVLEKLNELLNDRGIDLEDMVH